MQTGCLRPDVHSFLEARDHLFTYLPTWKVYPWVFALSSLDVSAINSHRWMVQLRKSALLIIIITFACNETGLSLLSSVYHRHRLPASFFCLDPLQNNELSCRDNLGTFHHGLSSRQGNHAWGVLEGATSLWRSCRSSRKANALDPHSSSTASSPALLSLCEEDCLICVPPTMAHLTKLVQQDSSWRQRSELEAMADLPPELERELQRLDKEFWVSTEELKQIVKVFHEELDEGTRALTKNELQRTKGR
jgi:hypothetical protein